MTTLNIKPDGACKYDLVALGEIMCLRTATIFPL